MKRGASLKRTAFLRQRVAINQRRSKPRRTAVFRSREYLDWLRERRCVGCCLSKMIYRDRLCASGSGPIDPAHGPSNGMSSKGPDDGAIPLCRDHHIEQHQIGWPAFEAKYGFSRETEAASHYAVFLIWKESQS